MICKSRFVHSFRSVAHYLETPKSHREDRVRVAWIEARNVVSDDSLGIAAREMALVAAGNVRVRRPCLHLSISWAPEDDPTKAQMTEVSDRILASLKLSEHQAMLVAHGDEHYAHLHAIANRVHPITRITREQTFFYRDIQETLRRAEREMNFRETPGHCYQLPGQSAPDRRESLSKRAHKTTQSRGEIPFQLLVRDAAEADFDAAQSWLDLHTRLGGHGLKLVPRGSGLVVTDGHDYAKCSSVARDASLRKLEKRFNAPWSSAEKCSLDHSIQRLGQVVSKDLTSSDKRALVKEFTRLDAQIGGLKTKLTRAVYDSLRTLANDEQQRGDLGR